MNSLTKINSNQLRICYSKERTDYISINIYYLRLLYGYMCENKTHIHAILIKIMYILRLSNME